MDAATSVDLQSVKALADENALLREEVRSLRNLVLNKQVNHPPASTDTDISSTLAKQLASANAAQAEHISSLINALVEKGANNIVSVSNIAETLTRMEKNNLEVRTELASLKAQIESLETEVRAGKTGSNKELEERIALLGNEFSNLKASAGQPVNHSDSSRLRAEDVEYLKSLQSNGVDKEPLQPCPKPKVETLEDFFLSENAAEEDEEVMEIQPLFHDVPRSITPTLIPTTAQPVVHGPKCFNCNTVGHLSMSCPEPSKYSVGYSRPISQSQVNGFGQGYNVPKCFNCDQLGHRSMNCPLPKRPLPAKVVSEFSTKSTINLQSTSICSQPAAATPKKALLSLDQVVELLKHPQPSIANLRIAAESVRRLLSSEQREQHLAAVVSAGLLEAMVKGLEVPDEKVQVESAWALTNVLAGATEYTEAAIQAGCVEPLMRLCVSESANVAEQALWAVTNVVGESVEHRDHLISLGLASILSTYVSRIDKLAPAMVRTLAWAYSNLVRHKNPQLPPSTLSTLAPSITAIIARSTDPVARQDACWAMSYLTTGSNETLKIARNSGVVPHVVKMLKTKKDSSVAPALHVLGNFSTGNDKMTQVVIDTGILTDVLPSLFNSHSSASTAKVACRLVSNVLAGPPHQIQAVIDAGLLKPIFNFLMTGSNRVQLEASYAVANLIHGGNSTQILTSIGVEGGLESICSSLNHDSNEIVVNTLEALYKIFTTVAKCFPKDLNNLKQRVEKADGLWYLRYLEQHENAYSGTYKTACKITNEFFVD